MVSILSVGRDCGLLSSRAAVLRRSNADVVTASYRNAIQILKGQKFDLVVLCHTLSMEEMIEVAQAAHELQKGAPVLQVVSDMRPYGQTGSVVADGVAHSDPASLVDKVVEMLHVTNVSGKFRGSGAGLQDNG